jgi:hypothetical protein
METRPLHECFAAHRALSESAGSLSRRLHGRDADASDLLRLGAVCIRLAAERALAARHEGEAIHGWRQCSLGDQQIRAATYRALRAGLIDTTTYDRTLALAIAAARSRTDELVRLRRRLLQQALA